jgi:hypothetical protein
MKKNEVILRLGIWDFEDVSHDEITSLIGISPVMVHIKGERINPKFGQIAKKNGWIMGSGHDKYTTFDVQMNSLLDIIESKPELFKSFSHKYYCEFSCAFFVYVDNGESTPWIHLNSRYNALIKDINIEFDLDLYCLTVDPE